ncbi:factor-independent urate hydroxylase [Nocardioides sp. LML1-1-1.1]|uniref:factor-independent urate hydroxylase n=1 Tax=Nocardioides sp. LML1-1-1.1 TaxID=3135248 RepID=UPI003435F9F7
MSDYELSGLQHGKAECRLVTVERGTAGHVLRDLTVSTQLRGDFAAAYTDGDNSHVHATDTQKNTVFALAREHGVRTTEDFLLALAGHWRAQEWVTGSWFAAEQHAWDRLPANDHSFARGGGAHRTAWVQTWGEETHVLAGVRDLVLLKSTGSEFHGFPRDRYTTLGETHDRILATSVTATWRYADTGGDWDARHETVRDALVDAFARTHSLALQQTIHAMGEAALDACPEAVEIRISCPNKHHFLVDLTPFGLDNPGEVFVAADRPYGLISATISRAGVPAAPQAWAGIAP